MSTQNVQALGGGRHAFSLLRRPYAYTVLYELSRGESRSIRELSRSQVNAAPSTLSELVEELETYGALDRRSRPRAGRTHDLVLTAYGRSLFRVAARLRGWVVGGPQRQQSASIGAEQAVHTIASHAEGSAGTILRRLCRAPTMRAELIKEMLGDSDAASRGLATIDRIGGRIRLMSKAGLIEVVDRIRGGHLYGLTERARGLAGPLAHAMALEVCCQPAGSRPPLACEVELILSLAGGRLSLPREAEDSDVLVKVHADGVTLAEIAFRIESGRAVELDPKDRRSTSAVAVETEDLLGSLLQGGTPDSTAVEGDSALASTFLQALASELRVPLEHR